MRGYKSIKTRGGAVRSSSAWKSTRTWKKWYREIVEWSNTVRGYFIPQTAVCCKICDFFSVCDLWFSSKMYDKILQTTLVDWSRLLKQERGHTNSVYLMPHLYNTGIFNKPQIYNLGLTVLTPAPHKDDAHQFIAHKNLSPWPGSKSTNLRYWCLVCNICNIKEAK